MVVVITGSPVLSLWYSGWSFTWNPTPCDADVRCRSDFYVWRVVARWKVLDLKRWKSHLLCMKRAAALARSHRKDESGADGHLYRCEDKSTTSGNNYSVCCSNDHKPLCHAILVLLSHVLLHPEYSVMLPFAVGSANFRSIHWCGALFEEVHPCCHDSSGRYFENAEYELPFASVTSKHLSKTPQEHMTNTCYKE